MASRVYDVHARQKTQLDSLARQRIGAGDDRLGGDDSCHRGQRDQTVVRPLWGELIEGIFYRTGLRQKKTSLAEIIQSQCGQRHCEPGKTNWQRAEMAHVGIER